MITIHTVEQGSPEWHTHRAEHFNASDAAAMLGINPYMSRDELLKRMATGITQEPTPEQQRIFDRGHAIEAACRPHAETIIGEDLAPIVGVSGRLSASFDGITFGGDVAWECKTLNAALREAIPKTIGEIPSFGSALPEHYRAQLEQQALVSGCERILFTAASINAEGEIAEGLHCWYTPDPAMRQRIIDGWAQFERDLAEWRPSETEPAQAIGKAPDALPALRIDVQGQVLASNLAEFKAQVVAVFAAINTDLQTDQDFADAEKTAKWCKGVEDKLEQAKENALSQTASIEEIFRTADDLKEVARQTRLTLEKAVKAQKEAVKTALVVQAQQDYASHISKLQLDLKGLRLNVAAPNFGDAIKGLKTVASMKERLTATLLEANSCANSAASRMVNNAKTLDSVPEHAFLFSDRQSLCEKDAETLELIIEQRVAQHKREQEAKLEAERARIRAEEEAKAKAAAARAVAEEQERLRKEAKAKEDERAEEEYAAIEAMKSAARDMAEEAKQKAMRENSLSQMLTEEVCRSHDAANAPTMQAAAVVKDSLTTQASINLTAINARLAPITLTARGIAELGIAGEPAGKSTLYTEAEFIELCRALTRHIREVATGQPA